MGMVVVACLAARAAGGVAGDNQVGMEINKLRRQLCEPLDLSLRSPILDDDVLPLQIPPLAQSLPKGVRHTPLFGRPQ